MASFLGSVFGDKPDIAPYEETTYERAVPEALGIDLANWDQIQQIGSLFQKYLLEGYATAGLDMRGILAGGSEMVKSMEETGKAFLEGKIPEDVAQQVQRTSAYQNLLSGGGGMMGQANVARNYGLTSLDLINKGALLAGEAGNAAQRWANLSGAGQAGNVMSGMLITPQQQAALTMQNNLYKQATEQTRKNVEAAPNPGLQQLNQWIEQVGGSVVATYLGGKPGSNYKTEYNPNLYLGSSGMPSDVTTPGHYVSSTTPGISPPVSFTDTTPYQSNIASNPWANAPAAPPVSGSGYNFNAITPYLGSPWAPNLYGTTDFNVTTNI